MMLLALITKSHPNYNNIILDCRDLFQQLENPPITHSYRETNRVADQLAKEGAGLTTSNSTLFWEAPPLSIHQALVADKEGTLFVRVTYNTPVLQNSHIANIFFSTTNITFATPMY